MAPGPETPTLPGVPGSHGEGPAAGREMSTATPRPATGELIPTDHTTPGASPTP